MACIVCNRVDGQNDPSPRSASPLDGELSSQAGGLHQQARKSPVSTDHLSSGGKFIEINSKGPPNGL